MVLPQRYSPPVIERYVNATSLEAALKALAEGDATVVAGGTDLWAQKNAAGGQWGRTLVNIRRVPEIAELSEATGRIRLGTLVTIAEILESNLLKHLAPVLPATANRFASVQIRNAATVGGNIVNASPAADMVLPLMCLDAEVELASWRDDSIATRRVPLTEMFTAPGRTVRQPDELLTAVEFAAPGPDFHAVFCKTGPRPALEIAVVSMCLAGYAAERTLTDVRLAYGAVAPTPVRCPKTEQAITGVPLDDAAIAAALDCVEAEINPIDDVRSSAWYRRHLARTFLEQELRHVAGD